MLSKFSVENFHSIQDEIMISFNFPVNRAHSFRQNILYEYFDSCRRCIMNGGIIFGANASGKTNLIKAMQILRAIIENSYKFNSLEDVKVDWEVFLLGENKNYATHFCIEWVLILDNTEYLVNYDLSINVETFSIEREKLTYKEILKTKVGPSIVLFERENNQVLNYDIQIHNIIKKVEMGNIVHKTLLSLINNDVNENYFSIETNSFEYKLIKMIYDECVYKIIFSNHSASRQFMNSLNHNTEYRKYILKNLRKFDFAIKDFEIEDISDDMIETFERTFIPEEIKKGFINTLKKQRAYRISIIHYIYDNKTVIPLKDESNGTKKFLNQSFTMYEALIKNGLYVADEFENAYHYRIQEGIINNFINQDGHAQFLIVSHNPLLMSKELFSKEQILLLEKDRDKEFTKSYQLSDFNVSYNNHNWINLYCNGRFGAVPEVLY